MALTQIEIKANSNTEVRIIEEFGDRKIKNDFVIALAKYFIDKYENAEIYVEPYEYKKDENNEVENDD